MNIRFAIFCSLLSSAVLAQTDLSDSTHMLDEVVISANKMPELRNKIPHQVYVIQASQISRLNLQTTADLIANSGMVAAQKSQQGGGSSQLRGFEASRVLLVIDGVRMNNLIYRTGHLQNVITLDNNSLERAEILFGPSSTVYGSDALGGVIHLKTKDPRLSQTSDLNFSANAFFRYGTVNNEKTTHVDMNVANKLLGSFTSFSFSDFGDLKMGKRVNPAYGEPFGLRNYYVERSIDNSQDVMVPNQDPYVQKFSGYSQYDLLQKFVLTSNERVRHKLNLQLSNSGRIPRYDRLTDAEGVELRNAEWYYGPQERFMTSYDLTFSAPGKIADVFNTILSYQKVKESRHTRRFNATERQNQVEDVMYGLLPPISRNRGSCIRSVMVWTHSLVRLHPEPTMLT